ncbi:dihydrofolate reductase family protein [Pricia sp.]|uniref:dihydrofolate reductase family protein n=1 Tax=Pricia sp. TaxID=2268138 RepID=UPI00359440D0
MRFGPRHHQRFEKTSETDIYLCGGGKFAGWLLENEMIDILKIKLNPLILGDGIRIFGTSSKEYQLKLMHNEVFNEGLSIITYQVNY